MAGGSPTSLPEIYYCTTFPHFCQGFFEKNFAQILSQNFVQVANFFLCWFTHFHSAFCTKIFLIVNFFCAKQRKLFLCNLHKKFFKKIAFFYLTKNIMYVIIKLTPYFFNSKKEKRKTQAGLCPENYILYHTPPFLSRVFWKKFCTNLSQKVCAFWLLTSKTMYVIIRLMPYFKSRAGRSAPKIFYYITFELFCQEVFEKNFAQSFPKRFVQFAYWQKTFCML